MAMILVLGATGYVGSRLSRRLARSGHAVRCLARHRNKPRTVAEAGMELVVGDVLRSETLEPAFEGIDIVFYLIHSMAAGEREFERLDYLAAKNVAEAAHMAGVKRIVYLGALGKKDAQQSPHLRSRHQVADVLRSSSTPVTEFRAAVIAGPGGMSFEMIHHLVNRLPFMICPRWVNIKTQPIAIDDIIHFLAESVNKAETTGRVIDVGGPDILTYRDMMLVVARVLGLKRYLVQVPVLTPRLSSYWVKLVTPLPVATARSLIESVRSETICDNDLAARLFDFQPMSFEDAARRALAPATGQASMQFDPASEAANGAFIDRSHFRIDRRVVVAAASARDMFAVVAAIGGRHGWYFANWLWRLRGAVDRLLGGIGFRRGRRHPAEAAAGDPIDFWRVVDYVHGRRLLLRAEIRVWGKAWLDFVVEPTSETTSRLVQTAWYYPRGLFGLFYWYLVYPIHIVVFKGMANAIARRAEETCRDRHDEKKDGAR